MGKIIGKEHWAFSGGIIPIKSTGKEPDFISQDKVSILNTGEKDALVKLTLYFTKGKPVSDYQIEVKSERVRKFRINDLIDPHAIELGVPYGCFIESNVPIVVQHTKQITSQNELAIMGTIAYSER